MLKRLQFVLEKVWTDEQYSKDFKKNKSVYRDFQHTIHHLSKAVNRLVEMIEEADHQGANSDTFNEGSVEKYLADIVICAVRAGSKAPGGAIDVQYGVINRMLRKMGVDIRSSNCVEGLHEWEKRAAKGGVSREG